MRMTFFDEEFDSNFMKRIQKMMSEIEKAMKTGELEGKWKVKQIDEPGVKGYVVQGRFGSDQPFNPFEPLEPLEPWSRRPMPQRPFRVPQNTLDEVLDPFIDVFDEEKTVKIYVRLPGEEKDDIQLNVTDGKFEVKAKKHYKMIDIPPRSIDLEKTSSRFRNGVLEVTIPKKEDVPEKEKRKIRIE